MSGEMRHVIELAENIGPRPATTDAEAEAAAYIEGVLAARGLDVERQEFDSPRTYAWAYVAYHLLTIAAAVASRWFPVPALVVAGIAAILLWLDLDLRFGLTSLMPKGPSQNVIGRHVPRARRGERLHKVVVVAHYDSARASLAFSPSMVKGFATTFGLMKALTIAVPVLILIAATPWLKNLPGGWSWVPYYVTLAASAYLLVPLFINIHREVAMKPVPGANDNASGVAAMLGVLERVVPEPEVTHVAPPPTRHAEEELEEADVVPPDAVLSYTSAAAPSAGVGSWADGEDDADWYEPEGAGLGQTTMDVSSPPRRGPRAAPAIAADEDLFGADDLFGGGASAPPPARETEPAPRRERGAAPLGDDLFGTDDLFGETSERPSRGGGAPEAPLGPTAPGGESDDVRGWLGVDREFNARTEGRAIGSWDRFDDDDDEAGWKGGAAGVDDFTAPDFAASEAARIRRKVTQVADRDLSEKEVWFVATGAEEVGSYGMRAFLRDYGHELRDAVIINLDNVGNGTVHYVSSEGMARRYRSDRRLLGATRRAVTEGALPVRSIDYRGLSTDATLALGRGYRAMSVMAFDINGRLPDWHWETDTAENVVEENLAQAADLVCAIMRSL